MNWKHPVHKLGKRELLRGAEEALRVRDEALFIARVADKRLRDAIATITLVNNVYLEENLTPIEGLKKIKFILNEYEKIQPKLEEKKNGQV